MLHRGVLYICTSVWSGFADAAQQNPPEQGGVEDWVEQGVEREQDASRQLEQQGAGARGGEAEVDHHPHHSAPNHQLGTDHAHHLDTEPQVVVLFFLARVNCGGFQGGVEDWVTRLVTRS